MTSMFSRPMVLVAAIGVLTVLQPLKGAVVPLFTGDLDAFNSNNDFGDGDLHGAEVIPESESPFDDGEALHMYDFNPDDKPVLQGELSEALLDPFRIDFQSFNESIDQSKNAIRFRMANSGKDVTSESRTAFSLSWQADGKFTVKYDRGDGGVSTTGIFLSPGFVTDITMVANPAESGTYTYDLFDEARTLNATSYDVFIDELLVTAEWENGLPFTLTKSVGEYDPALGLQRFGLFGSSNADVDPSYLFDNIILRTGFDIAPGEFVNGDTNLDGEIDVNDIDLLTMAILDGLTDARFDLNNDGSVNEDDHDFWVTDIKRTWFGDADLNGEFNSSDLVAVLGAGEYEDNIEFNSGWATGDWNADGEFTTSDLIVALADGSFGQGPRAATAEVPEPSTMIQAVAALVVFRPRRRRISGRANFFPIV